MNQRLIAAVVAVPLVLALGLYALFAKVPYAFYTTGGTVNVLGTNESGARILQVVGHPTYPDDGDLRMTFISVSPASRTTSDDDHSGWLTGVEAMQAWFDPDRAVLPYYDVHPKDETAADSKQQGAVQMKTSQDDAIAVALTELGLPVRNQLQVASVTPGTPADGKLLPYDVVTSLDGKRLAGATADDKAKSLVTGIQSTPTGHSITLGIVRADKPMSIQVTPVVTPLADGTDPEPRVGFLPGIGYKFPFDVSIHINPDIGGPSAGLMFSLATYDYLTPGSLTGGHDIAGTGEIEPDGTVGPIGGIQQKIATARDDGVQLYLVPKQNCSDAIKSHNAGDMRLVMATSMHEARLAIEKWVADPNAALPSCTDTDAAS